METENEVIKNMLHNNHEQVMFCSDEETGLKSIIAIHNTALGPALGGCRMWNYASEKEALNDALRLSRGMTYKAAITGLNLGGGKAIIIGDSSTQKTEKLLRRFGKFINNLGGKYTTGEDVGMTPKDMEYVRMETKHVVGVPEHLGGSGDPSPLTAYGILVGMKASLKYLTGKDSLENKKIAIQGLGHVGEHLLQLLQKEKANVVISDINQERINSLMKKYKVKSVSPTDVYKQNIDIFAPCALGAIINNKSINELKCKIIAGSANNQLANELNDGDLLRKKGILYAPDFLINAGGLINVASEMNGYNYNHVMAMVENIYSVCIDIFKTADKNNKSTSMIAIQMAEERIKQISELKKII